MIAGVANYAMLCRSSFASSCVDSLVDILDVGVGTGRRFQRLHADTRSLPATDTSRVRYRSAHRKSLQGFKGNPKKFYYYMRNLLAVKDAATTLRRSDGTTTTTDKETAEELKLQYQECSSGSSTKAH